MRHRFLVANYIFYYHSHKSRYGSYRKRLIKMKHLSIISDDIILYLKDIYHGALIYEAFRKHKSESIETSLIEHIIEVINHEHIHKAIYDLLYTPKGFKELGMNKVNQEVIVILTCLEMKKLGG